MPAVSNAIFIASRFVGRGLRALLSKPAIVFLLHLMLLLVHLVSNPVMNVLRDIVTWKYLS